MRRLHVTLAPPYRDLVARSRIILSRFPGGKIPWWQDPLVARSCFILSRLPNLRELVIEVPSNWVEMITLINYIVVNYSGVACCISCKDRPMYSSATPMSAELFQRGRRQGIGHIIIYQSLQPSFPALLQMATNAGVLHVTVINYTGDLGKVESNLQQFDSFSILREVGANEEVAEEEVAAANHLLDLLADTGRRGSLEVVDVPKVDFTN